MGIGRLQTEGIPECIHSRDVIPQLDQQARLAWLTLQLADVKKLNPSLKNSRTTQGTLYFLSNQTNPIYLLLKKNCDTPSR